MTCLGGVLPHIYHLYKMNLLITKQGGLISKCIKDIKNNLYECNIRGGYNNTAFISFFEIIWIMSFRAYQSL